MHQRSFFQGLSEHDRKVLDSIFLNQKMEDVQLNINPSVDSKLNGIIKERTLKDIISMEREKEAIKLTESGKLTEAIFLFDEALSYASHRGSIYNNRAQALRLKGDDKGALKDLTKAIDLSHHQLHTKCLALCQRGLLYRKLGNIDGAKHDFEAASKLGSTFARAQLVEINPYSALCNQMLRSIFSKLQENEILK